MGKTNDWIITSVWKRYDPTDPEQAPEEDGEYFVLMKGRVDRDGYRIVLMTFCKNVWDLISVSAIPGYEREEFLQFMKKKYKYGAFTEPMMGILPNYPQDRIIAFRTGPVDSIIDDLVKVFVTEDKFDVALEEAEDRLNQ